MSLNFKIFSFGKWNLTILGIFVICLQVFEKSVGDTLLTNFILRSSFNTYITYAAIVVISILIQFLFLYFYHGVSRTVNNKNLKILFFAISVVQTIISSILVYSTIEIAFSAKYERGIIAWTLLATYGMAFFFLGFLGWKLISSYISSKNKIVLLYSVAAIMLAFSVVINLLNLETQVSSRPDTITPERNPYGSYGSAIAFTDVLIHSRQIFGVASFVVTWLATVFLMKSYARSMGKIKYWTIVSIPLLYFLVQFFPSMFSILDELSLANALSYSFIYNSVVNSVQSAGGILFGLAFFFLAKEMQDSTFQKFLMLTGVGIMLTISSFNATSLIRAPYPPFGIASVTFLGVASYLLLGGLSNASAYVANDAAIRRALQKNLKKFEFLNAMGFHHVEKSVSHRVDLIMKSLTQEIDMTETTSSLSDEELTEYLEKVLQEKARGKSTSDTPSP